MNEKEREEFFKQAREQHEAVKKRMESVGKGMPSLLQPPVQAHSQAYSMPITQVLEAQRRKNLEALGRWVINRCIIGDTGGTSKA